MNALQVQWKETDSELDKLVLRAEALEITDQNSYKRAQLFLMGLKQLDALIVKDYKPQKQAMDAAKRVLLDEEAKKRGPVGSAIEMVGGKIIEWDIEQRRAQREAEAKAAEEAKKTGQIVPAVPAATATVEGFGFATTYKAVVMDKRLLIKAVDQRVVTEDVLEVVMPVANDWARTAGPQTKAAETPGDVVPMPGVPGLGIVAERRPRGK